MRNSPRMRWEVPDVPAFAAARVKTVNPVVGVICVVLLDSPAIPRTQRYSALASVKSIDGKVEVVPVWTVEPATESVLPATTVNSQAVDAFATGASVKLAVIVPPLAMVLASSAYQTQRIVPFDAVAVSAFRYSVALTQVL